MKGSLLKFTIYAFAMNGELLWYLVSDDCSVRKQARSVAFFSGVRSGREALGTTGEGKEISSLLFLE